MDSIKKIGGLLQSHKADVAIIGGGIMGLAHAYMALRRGLSVVLFEKDSVAKGASVEGYGLLAPVSELPAELGGGLEVALRTTGHWKNISSRAGFWCEHTGSLHLAYAKDEMDALGEFESLNRFRGYDIEVITPEKTLLKFPLINNNGLLGALWSNTEYTVDPRDAIDKITLWLEREFGLVVRYSQFVTYVSPPLVVSSKEEWNVERVVVCSGAEYEALFPEAFAKEPLSKCTSQLIKINPGTRIPNIPLWSGPAILHQPSFSIMSAIRAIDARMDHENILLKRYSISMQAVSDQQGHLIAGLSHQYSPGAEQFEREDINNLILEYLFKFLPLDNYKIIERWHGIYSNLPGPIGRAIAPASKVQIVTGAGEAGFTRCFALAEDLIAAW